MADDAYINSLVSFGLLSPSNIGILEQAFSCIVPKILRGEGRMVTSVTVPGQTVSWSQTMTLQEQSVALDQALKILRGKPLIRRTTMRYF